MSWVNRINRLSKLTKIPPLSLIRVLEENQQSCWNLPEDLEGMARTVKSWLRRERWWEEEMPERTSENPNLELLRTALRKWLRKGVIGSKSTRWESAKRAFSGEMRGRGEELMEILERKGYLKTNEAGGHKRVSINPERVEEIRKLVTEGEVSAGLREVLEEFD